MRIYNKNATFKDLIYKGRVIVANLGVNLTTPHNVHVLSVVDCNFLQGHLILDPVLV